MRNSSNKYHSSNCALCGGKYDRISIYITHLDSELIPDTNNIYTCNIGDDKFKTTNKFKMINHIIHWHTSPEILSNPFKCENCLQTFSKLNAFKIHTRKEACKKTKVTCDICNQGFLTKIAHDRYHNIYLNPRNKNIHPSEFPIFSNYTPRKYKNEKRKSVIENEKRECKHKPKIIPDMIKDITNLFDLLDAQNTGDNIRLMPKLSIQLPTIIADEHNQIEDSSRVDILCYESYDDSSYVDESCDKSSYTDDPYPLNGRIIIEQIKQDVILGGVKVAEKRSNTEGVVRYAGCVNRHYLTLPMQAQYADDSEIQKGTPVYFQNNGLSRVEYQLYKDVVDFELWTGFRKDLIGFKN